jgi:hypothetical protein
MFPKARKLLAAAAVVGALAPTPAQAQVPLSEILPQLYGNTIVLAQTGHEAHFRPGADALETPEQFNQQLVTQLSTFPLGSSSGGFTFEINPTLGTVEARSGSFGPAFAERALTIGRGQYSFGLNYQRATYDSFEGFDLGDGDILFYVPHIDPSGDGSLNPFFEGDVIEGALRLEVTSDTYAVFLNAGVTDDFDVGVAVPFVRVNMDAAVDARVLRLATPNFPGIHLFPGSDPDSSTFTSSGSKTGIGDLVLRGKWRFRPQEGGGLALAADVRLPTGDEENLLGTGAFQFKPYLIGSWTAANGLSPHLNIGYTFSGESDIAAIADEFNYTGGVDFPVTPQVTVAADLIGRTLRDSGRLVESDRVFQYQSSTGVPGSTTVQELQLEDGSLNLVLGAAGVKVNLGGTFLLNLNVLFPLTDAGLRDTFVPVIGFDYAF